MNLIRIVTLGRELRGVSVSANHPTENKTAGIKDKGVDSKKQIT